MTSGRGYTHTRQPEPRLWRAMGAASPVMSGRRSAGDERSCRGRPRPGLASYPIVLSRLSGLPSSMALAWVSAQ
jgi:hypothetical protein